MDTISYLHVNGVNLEIADAQARTNVTDLQANKADKTIVNTSIGEIEQDILELRAAVGTPLVANTVAGMTNHAKIYVYTGSESNYTNGNWYYWNGSSWASGGVYNSTAFTTDVSLTIEGAAADSAETGKRINTVSNEVFNYEEPSTDTFTLEKGTIATATGVNIAGDTYDNNRRRSIGYLSTTTGSIIIWDNDLYLSVYFYSTNASSGYIGKTEPLESHYIIKNTDEKYIRIVLKKKDGSDFGENEFPVITYISAESRINDLENAIEPLQTSIENLESVTENLPELEKIVNITSETTNNLITTDIGSYYANTSGTIIHQQSTNLRVGMSDYIPCKPSTYYTFSMYDAGTTTRTTFYIAWKDSNGDFIQRNDPQRSAGTYTYKMESPENAAYVNFSTYNTTFISSENTKLQIEEGNITKPVYIDPYSSIDNISRENIEKIKNVSFIGLNYPEYFQENLEEAASLIFDNMLNVGPYGDSFVFITDVHWGSNQKHSPQLINYIINNTNIRNVLCGGDILDSSSDSYEFAKVKSFMKAMDFCPGGLKTVAGNHDFQHNNHNFNSTQTYSMLYPQAEMEWQDIHLGSQKIYGYFDVPATKTRYLNIGMAYGNIRSGEIHWIEEQITTNQDKNIIIMAHYLFYPNDEYFTADAKSLMKLCSAYPNVKTIIYGHIHADKVDYTPSGIPVIAVDTDSSRISETLNPYDYTIGTITEQAFDSVTVNYTNMDVRCARVGRGKHRIIHGGTIVLNVSGITTLTAEHEVTIWSSSSDAVAMVSEGLVTGLSSGTAVICADSEKFQEYWSITVGTTASTSSVTVNSTTTLQPVLLQTITASSWASLDTSIATVNNGVVTGVSQGKVAIKASGTDVNGVANTEYWDVIVQ